MFILFSAAECVEDSPVSMTFTRGRHEHVDGAGNRSQRRFSRRTHTETEVLDVHRQLNQTNRQIFIQEQFLAGTVHDSDPPILTLDFKVVTEQSARLLRLSRCEGSALGRVSALRVWTP
jgi:hypothetical protein